MGDGLQEEILTGNEIGIEDRHELPPGARKAGALTDGMASAKGEFVAIFDADFVPRPTSYAR